MANYCKGIIKHVEELIVENEGLKGKIKELRAENTELRQRMGRLEGLIERRIARAVEKACMPLTERILYLESENERKDAEITRLKAQANKDSTNSSKPPGTDAFKKVINSREKSRRSQGSNVSPTEKSCPAGAGREGEKTGGRADQWSAEICVCVEGRP